MKPIALSLGLLAAAVLAFSTPAAAEFEIQMHLSEMNNATSAAEVKEAFRLAAAARHSGAIGQAIGSAAADDNRDAIVISCAPASSKWCAKDFVAACKGANGRMSPNSTSGATCALP